ncbi:TetR/AcrR family transcriptional regulator [Flindersiella endophytica]
MPEPLSVIWNQPPPPRRQRSLGREEIVAAAIDLADEQGVRSLTMKTLAARLGSYSPMALYRYVYSKEGLIDLMLDAAVAEVSLPERPSGDWRTDLWTLAIRTRQMTQRHPWYAQLVHSRPPAGPSGMLRTEFVLTVLLEQGVSTALAMTYAALLDRYIVGSGLQEAEEARFERAQGLTDAGSLFAAIGAVRDLAAADGQVPHLTEWLSNPSGPTAEEQFELGLTFLLDGISARI